MAVQVVIHPHTVRPRSWSTPCLQDKSGCFKGGTYIQARNRANNKVKITRKGIKLRSVPGKRATIRAGIHVAKGANGVVVRNLKLDGSRAPRCKKGDTCNTLPSPIVNANYTRWIENDVTNRHTAICFILGNKHTGAARRTLIKNNRIHNCGRRPVTNLDHGIYLDYAKGTRILNNAIYDNADRGIQLRSNADGTIIQRNIIDGNGQGIIFSGNAGKASDNTKVRKNIISNSRVRHNVEHWYPSKNPVGRKNFVKSNCLWASHSKPYYRDNGGVKMPAVGYKARSNVVKAPRYVNRGAKNFRLRKSSPCRAILR